MKTSGVTLANVFVGVCMTILSFVVNTNLVYAQSYVPVQDDQLSSDVTSFNDDFNDYVTNLFDRWDKTFGANEPDGTTDSLRDLIAGSNPKAPGDDQGCAFGDNLLKTWDNNPDPIAAYAYGAGDPNQANWGPWKYAFETSTAEGGSLPEGIAGATDNSGPYPQVNYSHSLRCLLEEQVEWQKLGLSIQIHSLLKNYISDAQQAQLTKQLKNRLAAANLTFAKGGNQVNNGGVISNSPVFVTSYNQNILNVSDRQLEAITDQAAADPTAPPAQGSLGICQPWRVDVAADMVRNNRTKVEDPYKYTSSYTKCNLADASNPDSPFANAASFQNFSDNFNDPVSLNGGLSTFSHMINNPQDTPIGSITLLDAAAADRIARQTESTKAGLANSGFAPTSVCSGDAADPHCLPDQFGDDITANQGNADAVTGEVSDLRKAIDSNTIDSQSATSSQGAPTDIITNTGYAGANTTPLETSGTAVNKLVQEFYDAINFGYFGTNGSTREWAQGTMLSIYDEMKFNQDLTNGQGGSIVTAGEASLPTGY